MESLPVLLLLIAQMQPPQPEAVVRQLYTEIVARRPLGIPAGADKEALWPLLSTRLVRQLETAQVCEDDYRRQHAHDDGKPEFGWLEYGLFSGGEEEALPAEVDVERIEPLKAGAFRVLIRLTYRERFETYGRPPDSANFFRWRVAVMVVAEGGRFLVDDVAVFEDDSTRVQSRLSREFVGCSGARWVGVGKRR
jgi:hypothetical protein